MSALVDHRFAVKSRESQSSSLGGLVRQKFLRQHPVDDLAIAWLHLSIAPALERLGHPSRNATVCFFDARWSLSLKERAKPVHQIHRRPRCIVRDNLGDAKPTPLVETEIVIG